MAKIKNWIYKHRRIYWAICFIILAIGIFCGIMTLLHYEYYFIPTAVLLLSLLPLSRFESKIEIEILDEQELKEIRAQEYQDGQLEG